MKMIEFWWVFEWKDELDDHFLILKIDLKNLKMSWTSVAFHSKWLTPFLPNDFGSKDSKGQKTT